MKSNGQATALMIFIIVAVIALVGLLLTLGAVKTGKLTWQEKPTAPSCPPGWISAWAHSTNHTDMLNSGFQCTQSIVRNMVCCAH
ncbi:MAG: hypothetical protein QW666_03030 [Candidatus Woesearchaeota archaeon]